MFLWIAAYLFYLKGGGGRNHAVFLRYDDNDDFGTRLCQCQMKITRSIHIDAITACYLVIFLPSYGLIHIDYRHNPPATINRCDITAWNCPAMSRNSREFFRELQRSFLGGNVPFFLSSIDRSSHLMIAVYRFAIDHMLLHRREKDEFARSMGKCVTWKTYRLTI